ncbi:MAG: hypothetical protein LJE84_07500 [Gammaproteobacteria bacterium]|nr:hypothetical protein [Gammaproteobacteria bacterium]
MAIEPGAESGRTCILVSASEPTVWLARFTAERIAQCWSAHPPLFFCGSQNTPDERWLRRGDPHEDWIGILRSAVSELGRRGYTRMYLVLDDHPPLFRCHAGHLNETLPHYLDELDAVYIGLNGWGQGREPCGRVLANHHRVENVAADFRWKFSLHPGLWNLAALSRLLDWMLETLPPERRSAWVFERFGGGEQLPDEDRWQHRCYRVSGIDMTASAARRVVRNVEWVAWRGLNAVAERGPRGLRRRIDFLRRYYEGPYPLFWSGLMQKGKVFPDAQRFLRWRLRFSLLADFRRARATAPRAWVAGRDAVSAD